MKRGIFLCLPLALLLVAGLPHAAETKGATAPGTQAIGTTDKAGKSVKPGGAAAKVKLVDINSASKAELKTLPRIGDAEAERIIAGRPYLSKANLTTHNIVSREIYDGLRSRVVAVQNKATAAKLEEMQKRR